MGVDSDRDPEGPSQAKVRQFNHSFVVNQQVLGFQVPVKDAATVAEENALKDLVKVTLMEGMNRGGRGKLQASVRNPLIAAETHLHQHGVHVLAGWDGVQVLLQVHGQKLKDKVQTGVVHQNFQQPRIHTILT